jgi:serine/threonine-protein kinase
VTQLAAGHRGHLFAQFHPDGTHVLYFVTGAADIRGAYVVRLDGTPPRKLLDVRGPAVYASTGHLLFVRENALFAQEFDPARLELKGNPVRVADRVAVSGSGGADLAAVSTSNTGAILYRGAPTGGGRQLTWFDRSGKTLAQVGKPDSARRGGPLSLSPDGRWVALARTMDGNADIWVLDLERSGVMTRFTSDAASEIFPLFHETACISRSLSLGRSTTRSTRSRWAAAATNPFLSRKGHQSTGRQTGAFCFT